MDLAKDDLRMVTSESRCDLRPTRGSDPIEDSQPASADDKRDQTTSRNYRQSGAVTNSGPMFLIAKFEGFAVTRTMVACPEP